MQQISFEIDFKLEDGLTLEQRKDLDAPISIKEISKALMETKRFKGPGPDGLPADWYKMFFPRIKQTLVDAFNYDLKYGKIYNSGREGIISLIPKKSDSRFLKNWRPITLLCMEYKLLAKVLANRIKPCLDTLISKDQNAFVGGRNITTNVRKLIDLVYLCDKKKIADLILSIDFMKAFDRVKYKSLIGVMKLMNFGPNMCDWILTLFKDFRLVTVNNGYSSDPLFLTRGLFQENPISPIGFVKVIELLAILIKRNKKIKGITINSIEYLLSMFADDIDICIQNKPQVWEELRNTIAYFESLSGLKVNYDKSSVYRLGSTKKTNAMAYAMKKLHWSEGSLNILGIEISKDYDEMLQLNYNKTLEKAKKVLEVWKMCDLSLMGATIIFNSLVASLFIYKMQVVPMITQNIAKQINEMARNFIWQGKKSKITINILQGDKLQGGLGVTDMSKRDKSLKIQWVFRALKDKTIRNLAYEILQNPMGNLIWETLLNEETINQVSGGLKNFGGDVIRVWTYLNTDRSNPFTKSQVECQVIWWNCNIKIEKKVGFL